MIEWFKMCGISCYFDHHQIHSVCHQGIYRNIKGMNNSTFLKQVSHIVNIDAHKTFRSVEYIHNATYNLFSLLLQRNLLINEGKNRF